MSEVCPGILNVEHESPVRDCSVDKTNVYVVNAVIAYALNIANCTNLSCAVGEGVELMFVYFQRWCFD